MTNKRKLTDRGFTLIEVLVAVAILAVVMIPLIHAMVTSAQTASKSSRIQTQTAIAQNVAETVDSLKLSDILTDITGYCAGTAADTGVLGGLTADARVYTYDAEKQEYTAVDPAANAAALKSGLDTYYIGLKNVSFSNGSYDVMVKLDAKKFSAVNSAKIAEYTSMDAVFAQPKDNGATLENPDSLAASDFAAQASLLSGTSVAASEFINKMVRDISVNVAESGTNVTATATYSYTSSYTYNGTTTALTFALSPYYFFTGSVDSLQSMYFFYYPNYCKSQSKDYDNITVYNNDGLAFDFFLVKQYTPNLTDAEINGYETQYQAKLALREPYDAQRMITKTPIASLYTNMNVVLGIDFDLYNSSVLLVYNGVWFTYGKSSGNLVSAEALNRLYGVTIDLYAAGGNFTGEPLYELTASTVE